MAGVQVIALVAVLAVALATAVVSNAPSVGIPWFTPEFITALAGLIAVIVTLIQVLRGQQTTQETHDAVQTVAQQTNGVVSAMQDRLTYLERELAGTAHRSAPRAPTGSTGPTSAPQ